MTDERLVRSLAIALDDLAAARTPDYLEAAIERASSRPQRPASTFPERWLPMDLVTRRQILAPNVPWRTLGTLALLALLIAAVLAAYVGSQRRVPAPFGIAANGLVAFVDADGAILQADPLTGESDVIVPGPGNEGPIHSPDGTRLAYLRKDPVGRYDIVVAQADGQRPVVITTESLIAADYFGWAPTSATVVVSVPFGGLQTYDGSTPSATRTSETSFGPPWATRSYTWAGRRRVPHCSWRTETARTPARSSIPRRVRSPIPTSMLRSGRRMDHESPLHLRPLITLIIGVSTLSMPTARASAS